MYARSTGKVCWADRGLFAAVLVRESDLAESVRPWDLECIHAVLTVGSTACLRVSPECSSEQNMKPFPRCIDEESLERRQHREQALTLRNLSFWQYGSERYSRTESHERVECQPPHVA